MKADRPKSRVSFRFYGSLNDFLPENKKNIEIVYRFWGKPSIKDAIEALGIPHCEINFVLIDGSSCYLNHSLTEINRVDVYPLDVIPEFVVTKLNSVYKAPDPAKGFVLDVQLGKLARYLRILGLDTLYRNNYSDEEIVDISAETGRTILTRDIGLLKRKRVEYGYWVRMKDPELQFSEVVSRFLKNYKFDFFSRCLVCNALISTVNKEEVKPRLKPRTVLYYDDFLYCGDCKKVYWKGSHVEHMQEMLDRIIPRS